MRKFSSLVLMVLLGVALNITKVTAQDCDAFVNPNLDEVNLCPDNFGQTNRFIGWNQTTAGTSDGFCDCNGPWDPTSFGLCPTFADNFLGFFGYNTSGYAEYVGQCLITPFQAGEEYEVSFKIFQSNGNGIVPINIMGYQGTTCPTVPYFSGNGGWDELCGRPNWVVLGSQSETSSPSDNAWTTMTYTFTAPSDIAYIAIGVCSYAGAPSSASTYFTIDEFCIPTQPVEQECTDPNLYADNCDFDGDGYLNGDDLDDDNDGILDTEECNVTNASSTVVIPTSVSSTFLGYEFSVDNLNITDQANEDTDENTPFFASCATQNPEIFLGSTGELSGTLIMDIPSRDIIQMILWNGWATACEADHSVSSFDLQFFSLGALIGIENFIAPFYTGYETGDLFTFSQVYQRIDEVRMVINNGQGGNEIGIREIVFISDAISSTCGTDTDNDGSTNSFDLDSDGDGCPDAIEGGATFTQTNLDADNSLTGAVDGNGIPIVAGANGQTIGDSQDMGTQGLACEPPCKAGNEVPILIIDN